MASNKAKRSIHLAQPERRRPNPQPTELMPVKAHIYRAIAELNGGFEKVIQDLKTLQQVSFFRSGRLVELPDLMGRVRAQANYDLIMTLHEREKANAAYFEGLCMQSDDAGEWKT